MLKTLQLTLLCFGALTMHFALLAQTPPANDSCQNAIPVMMDEVVEFSTIGADSDGPNHPDDCISSDPAPDSLGADIWYTFTAPTTGFVIWTMCSTADFDTKIAVYTPGTTCPPTNDDLLACNEDGTVDGVACANATSAAPFEVTEGETYLLRLGGWVSADSASAGTGEFVIETYVPPATPDNDDCENAIAISLGENQEISNNGATTDGPTHPDDPICFGFNDNTAQMDIWYTFTSPITGTVEWSTCGTVNWDSRLVVYGPDIDCASASPDNMIACSDATSGCEGFTNILFFDAEVGVTYLMRVGGYGGAQGSGTFDLTEANPPEPPANDACANPDSIWIITPQQADDFDVSFNGTTISATGSGNIVDPLCGTGQGGDFPDVWYKFNTVGNTEVEVRFTSVTAGAEYYLELYESCDGLIDTAVDTFCVQYTTDFSGVLVDTISNLMPEPKEYLLRISSWIFNPPGDYILQLVGEIVTDTEEELFPGKTRLFPNPTSGQLNLKLDLQQAVALNVEIHNTLGEAVYREQTASLGRGNHTMTFNANNWPPGIYFMVLRAENAVETLRFIKS